MYIAAGEAIGSLTGTEERIYMAAESGVQVFSSSDNMTSGLNHNAILIDSNGNSYFENIYESGT
jgi:hypothetical protein